VRTFESLVKDNIQAAEYFLRHQEARLEMWKKLKEKVKSA
jgi:hypothetical protein